MTTPGRTGRTALVSVLASMVLAACGPPAPGPAEWDPVPEPATDEIANVVFLVGDGGEATPGHSPVMARLQGEVERWSARLARDSAVAVAYLGDIVYPYGVRVGHPGFEMDSLRLQAHVNVLAGPAARRHRTVGLFLAGNHDWGQMPAPEGLLRLENLQALLADMVAQQGVTASLVPNAGRPGPHVLDLGERLRLVSLDTHWWLQSQDLIREDSVIQGVADALDGAGERHVVLLSHHPFASGGAHGGPMPIWEGLGILWLLRKSGTLVQDINSIPYKGLRLGLSAVFAEVRRPLLWAGGHDHSLQVLRGRGDGSPHWNVVSGSASKLTDVVDFPGMVFGADRPGFMRLTALKDGSVLLHVYAADDSALLCEGSEAEVEACMAENIPAFEVVWAERLR